MLSAYSAYAYERDVIVVSVLYYTTSVVEYSSVMLIAYIEERVQALSRERPGREDSVYDDL